MKNKKHKAGEETGKKTRGEREGQSHQADSCSLPASPLLCTGNGSLQPEGEEAHKGLQTAVGQLRVGAQAKGRGRSREEGRPW